jgi:hypothetical protein
MLLTRPMTKTRSAPRISVDPWGPTDYFGPRDELTDADRDYLRRARACVDNDVLPVINGYWERAQFPWPLIKKIGHPRHRRGRHQGLRLPGDGHYARGCNTRGGPAAGDRPGLRLCREMLAVQREFAKSLAATAASATEAARQQSESVVGAVWQPAEDTTEAVPRATKTANNLRARTKGQT